MAAHGYWIPAKPIAVNSLLEGAAQRARPAAADLHDERSFC